MTTRSKRAIAVLCTCSPPPLPLRASFCTIVISVRLTSAVPVMAIPPPASTTPPRTDSPVTDPVTEPVSAPEKASARRGLTTDPLALSVRSAAPGPTRWVLVAITGSAAVSVMVVPALRPAAVGTKKRIVSTLGCALAAVIASRSEQ